MNTEELVLRTFQETGCNVAATARATNLSRGTVYYYLKKSGSNIKPLAAGQMSLTKLETRNTPRSGVKRYLLTCAQNNTHLNPVVWNNMVALAEHYGAELFCASYTYNTHAYGKLAVKPGTYKAGREELWFDERIRGLLEKSDRNIELAPGLVWCGRMNTLPTTAKPLNGFETYTGRRSGIFPHARLAMQSIASGKHEATKLNFTTGTVTQLNYIQKAAGLKAEHHHTYGGLIVEVDNNGRWWVRQLNADKTGVIHDLDIFVQDGTVHESEGIEAITWGDVHATHLDPAMLQACWGDGGMMDELKPRYQFVHDLLDFRARNHHEIRDPHKRFTLWATGKESVDAELQEAAQFLHIADRPWCSTVVVDSNHDNALTRWLKEADWRADPVNAEFFLEAQLALLKSIRAGRGKPHHVLNWAMRRAGCPPGTVFLDQDESYIICRDRAGGIECGMHGHLGPNGARGNPNNLSRMGRRANIGHSHSAAIIDGLYVAGCTAKLDLGYNVGPSSWSHSHIVTYRNGKRAIVTMWEGKWRA